MIALTHLSLQRAPRLHKQMPTAYTNEQRYREYRIVSAMRSQAPRHNAFDWRRLRANTYGGNGVERQDSIAPATPTPYGSQSAATQAPDLPNDPAGCLPDPPAPDDYTDADGNALDYASLSRGW